MCKMFHMMNYMFICLLTVPVHVFLVLVLVFLVSCITWRRILMLRIGSQPVIKFVKNFNRLLPFTTLQKQILVVIVVMILYCVRTAKNWINFLVWCSYDLSYFHLTIFVCIFCLEANNFLKSLFHVIYIDFI